MSSNDAPPAPDYSPIANASMEQAQLSFQLAQDQLAWAKAQYAKDRELTDKVAGSFIETQNLNNEAARKDRERYEQVFQPLEDQLASDAQSYASEERKDLERGRAMATVGQQFDAARNNAERQLESFGIDPSAVRYAALDIGVRAQEAATKAAAANQSDQMVDATGRALRSEAINVGRGYPGQVAGTYGTALAAGTGAVNSNLATTASGANTMGTAPQYTGLGYQGLGSATQALNTGFQNQMSTWKANQESSSGIGTALGLLAGVGGKALLGPAKPWVFAADGGAIPDPSEATPGGPVPEGASPTGGAAVDDVSARLTAGEFVVPKDVVAWEGEKFFQNLIEKARKAKGGAGAKPEMKSALPTPPTFASRPAALPLR